MNSDWIFDPCPAPNERARQQAVERQAVLTKPAGSLGRLEEIAIDFAGWQAQSVPTLNNICVRIFAADHGICDQNVSAFPQAVTGQMIQNFISGGAAISVLAESLGADFAVTNLGTVDRLTLNNERLINKPIAQGTRDFSKVAAMTETQLCEALNLGRTSLRSAELFIGGEMGIGNTSSAAAIYAALLGLDAKQTVGPGTGIDKAQQTHKAEVIQRALDTHIDQLISPLATLQNLGGFEISGLVGAYIAAAQNQTPILVDGFICTAAALIASQLNPSCRAWMLFAHESAEPAHALAIKALGAEPLLSLSMRLGEGSGAAVAVPIIKNALLLHAKMATFADAGVSDKDE